MKFIVFIVSIIVLIFIARFLWTRNVKTTDQLDKKQVEEKKEEPSVPESQPAAEDKAETYEKKEPCRRAKRSK